MDDDVIVVVVVVVEEEEEENRGAKARSVGVHTGTRGVWGRGMRGRATGCASMRASMRVGRAGGYDALTRSAPRAAPCFAALPSAAAPDASCAPSCASRSTRFASAAAVRSPCSALPPHARSTGPDRSSDMALRYPYLAISVI